VTEANSPRAPAEVFSLGVPVLGICYGMQTMAEQLGGKVESGHNREFGLARMRIHLASQASRAHPLLQADCLSSNPNSPHGCRMVTGLCAYRRVSRRLAAPMICRSRQ
jgi:hypothetical protein